MDLAKKLVGRPGNKLRKSYREKYKLSRRQALYLTPRFLKQLEACEDEATRRILLGISK